MSARRAPGAVGYRGPRAAGGRTEPIPMGTRFGALVVEGGPSRVVDSDGTTRARWSCRCDCGRLVEILGSNLRRGHARSCGCAKGRRP